MFPMLKNGYKLYKNHVHSYVEPTIKDNMTRYVLNQDAARIVDKCDGSLNIVQIARDLSVFYGEDYDNTIKTILKYITAQEYLAISKTPIKGGIKKSGNWNYQHPSHATIELTDRCNFSCKHCYCSSDSTKNTFLDKTAILRVLDGLNDMGVEVVEFTGGEPCLHPEFISIIQHALNYFSIIPIITNGSVLVDNGPYLEYLFSLKNTDKICFQISLHSCTKDYMDIFCGYEGAFDNAKSVIEILSPKFTVRVVTIITPDNIDQLFNISKLAKSLRANLIMYSFPIPIGKGESLDLTFSQQQLKAIDSELSRVNSVFDDFMFQLDHCFFNIKERINCGAGSRSICIASNGNVKICPMMDSNFFSLGNVYENDLEYICSGKTGSLLAKLKAPSNELCGKCKDLSFCEGCLARGLHKFFYKENCVWGENASVEKIFNDGDLKNE